MRGRRMLRAGERRPAGNLIKCPYCYKHRRISSYGVTKEGQPALWACLGCRKRRREGQRQWWRDTGKAREALREETQEEREARLKRSTERLELVKKHGVRILRKEGLIR